MQSDSKAGHARTRALSLSLSIATQLYGSPRPRSRAGGNLRLFAGYADKMPYVTKHEEAHASRNFDSVKDEEQWLVRRY